MTVAYKVVGILLIALVLIHWFTAGADRITGIQ